MKEHYLGMVTTHLTFLERYTIHLSPQIERAPSRIYAKYRTPFLAVRENCAFSVRVHGAAKDTGMSLPVQGLLNHGSRVVHGEQTVPRDFSGEIRRSP